MMKGIDAYSLKVMVGRNDLPVPMVNDVYLHSLYDPIKEADVFIRKNREKIFQKNYFLVLGLGFAYHVNRLVSDIKDRLADRWGVAVIEPNERVFKECMRLGMVPREKRLHIFKGMDVQGLYAEKGLVDFMMLSPVVLVHETSYDLYLDYYKEFLNYRADTKAHEISRGVDSGNIRQYLLRHGDDDIFSLKESVKEKVILSREEILLGAFFSICEDTDYEKKGIVG